MTGSPPLPAFPRGYAYISGLGLAMGMALMNLPPALEALRPHYAGGFLGMGVLITALLWSHALIQLPGGVLTDRLGIKNTLALGMTLIAVGNLGAALVTGLTAAAACRVLAGMGTGVAFAAAMKLVAQESPPARAGSRQAYLGGVVALGSIAAFGLIPLLVAWDWRLAHAAPGVAAALLLVPTWLRPMPATPPPGPWAATLAHLAGRRHSWILGLLHGLSWGSVLTLGNWAAPLMGEVSGGGTGGLAWAGALVMAIGGLGRILGGPLLAGLEPRRVTRASMLLLTLAFAGVYLLPGSWGPGLSLLAAVICASVNFGAIFQLASEAAGPASQGTLLGLVNMVANLVAIAFTLLCGWVRDWQGSFEPAFLVMAAIALAASFLAGRLDRGRLAGPGRKARISS